MKICPWPWEGYSPLCLCLWQGHLLSSALQCHDLLLIFSVGNLVCASVQVDDWWCQSLWESWVIWGFSLILDKDCSLHRHVCKPSFTEVEVNDQDLKVPVSYTLHKPGEFCTSIALVYFCWNCASGPDTDPWCSLSGSPSLSSVPGHWSRQVFSFRATQKTIT